MSTLLGDYSETTTFKDVEDDLWSNFYNNWYKKGCPLREKNAQPGDNVTLTQDEIETIEKHSKRSQPAIIKKGEKHVRKFFYDGRGSFIWRANLEIYKIAEKYKVIPPDQRDFSQSTTMPTHVYNQSKI